MDVPEIRTRFLRFYAERGHAAIAAAPLVPPVGDDSTLFTTAGMQPLVPFFLGQAHPAGRLVCDVQPCLRTDDIDEVGDATHLTLLEMLGRWSLGGYGPGRAIELTFEWLTGREGLGLDPRRLYATFFAGDEQAPRDDEAREAWRAAFAAAGVEAPVGDGGTDAAHARVYGYGAAENWWGPVGETGPCGPDAEVYYDTGRAHDGRLGPACHPACPCGRFVEIGNDVFLRYERLADGRLLPLAQQSVDTGMGLERLAQVVLGAGSAYETGAFAPLTGLLERLAGRPATRDPRSFRILADHLRAATFVAAAGVLPATTGRGYVLRRLVRRAVRYGRLLELPPGFCRGAGEETVRVYADAYPELAARRDAVLDALDAEEARFARTLARGLGRVERLLADGRPVSGDDGFRLFDTFGFPVELTVDVVRHAGGRLAADFDARYAALMAEQRERSRRSAAFGGGLACGPSSTS